MKKLILIFINLVLLVGLGYSQNLCENDPNFWDNEYKKDFSKSLNDSGFKLFGYYADWLVEGFDYKKINYQKIDVFLHPFVRPGSDGTLQYFDNFVNTGFIDMVHKNGKKVLLSIGGYGNSYNFSYVLNDNDLKQKFLSGIIEFVNKYGYDGVDIDREFPNDQNQGDDFVYLVAELKRLLPGKYITIAVSISPSSHYINFCKLQDYVDYILVMAYDIQTGWQGYAGHNAPVYHNSSGTMFGIDDYLKKEFFPYIKDRSKLVLGFPLYGRVYETNNLYDSIGYSTIVKYKDIDFGGCKRYFDSQSLVPYLLCDGYVYSYDDIASFYIKFDYVKQNGIGGMFFWSIGMGNNILLDKITTTKDMSLEVLGYSGFDIKKLLYIYENKVDPKQKKLVDDFLNKLYILYEKDFIKNTLEKIYNRVVILLISNKYPKHENLFKYIIFRIYYNLN